MEELPYQLIAHYGVIGDTRTAALVGKHGSIDWCCFPRFDSRSAFAAILDHERGGRFSIEPAEPYTSDQRYLSATNILVTTFHTHSGSGVVEVMDFMPAPGEPEIAGPLEIHRRVRCVRGSMTLDIRVDPRLDYGRGETRLRAVRHGLLAEQEGEVLALAAPDDLEWEIGADGARSLMRLESNARRWLVLRYDDDEVLPVGDYLSQECLERTAEFWNLWAAGLTYTGRYRAEVERSALALKLLFYAPTGAVVAAPTTSLPEAIGGARNWDYRFCWLRDAAFTLSAFHIVGLYDEADRFMRYLRWVAARGVAPLQIMYGIGGETELEELELPHLRGYAGSAPVRVGNAAHEQLQLDVYGELLEAAWLWHQRGMVDQDFWALLRTVVDWVVENWDRPDCGIWEVRAAPRHYVHSKVMCWVALDRAIRMAEQLDAPCPSWIRARDAIHAAVMERGWSESRGAFTQSFGSDALDAANLLIPLVGFLPPEHPRVKATIEATLRELTRDGMLYRYTNDDGIEGGEGVFAICTFWLADALILSGAVDDGERVFRRMLRFSSRLGLYSEELDPRTGDFLGNFPQAFTHIALINTAELLRRARSG